MTIAYDASRLVGWKALPILFCRWRGTIFSGVFFTPMFWILNGIHGALVFVPWYITEERKREDPDDYVPFEFHPLDWSISTAGMALLFFFMCACSALPAVHAPAIHLLAAA